MPITATATVAPPPSHRHEILKTPKYKRITDERVPNADLHRLLAYATALAADRRLDDTAWRRVIIARSSLRCSGRT